jgi:hypothetical protein
MTPRIARRRSTKDQEGQLGRGSPTINRVWRLRAAGISTALPLLLALPGWVDQNSFQEVRRNMRYRVVIECTDIPAECRADVVSDILEEFAQRPWHESVECELLDSVLRLSVENDFDASGGATSDEFSDALSAVLPPFDGNIRLVETRVIAAYE